MLALIGSFFGFIILVAFYVWTALCLYIIAKKTNTPNEWLAWIPFAEFYLMCRVGRKPVWWTALLCLPLILVSFAFVILIFTAMGSGEIPQWIDFLSQATLLAGLIFSPLFATVWMAISRERSRPSWFGILMIIPIANLVIPGILAFSDVEVTVQNTTIK
jgi:hypothetical protein